MSSEVRPDYKLGGWLLDNIYIPPHIKLEMEDKCRFLFDNMKLVAEQYQEKKQWYDVKKNTPQDQPYYSPDLTQAKMCDEIEKVELIYAELKRNYRKAMDGQCNFDRLHHSHLTTSKSTNGYLAFRERYFQELRGKQ